MESSVFDYTLATSFVVGSSAVHSVADSSVKESAVVESFAVNLSVIES